MRKLVLGLLLPLSLTGCNLLSGKGKAPPDTSLPKEMPSATSLVKYLNDNGGRINSVNVNTLELDYVGPGGPFGLRGKMLVEKPRNFRLGASVVGAKELDLGSNDQEFWFWLRRGEGLKPGEPSPQFFCSYKDLNEGKPRIMPLPFQPEWIMETLGLGPYGPAEKYTLDGSDKTTIRMVEKATSPTGKPVKKVIVFNRRPVAPPQPQVMQYLLLDDATGKEICSATILDVQVDKGTGAILPRRIELSYPEQKVKLTLRLDETAVNGPTRRETFVRQELTGVRSLDLAVLHLDPDLVRPVEKR